LPQRRERKRFRPHGKALKKLAQHRNARAAIGDLYHLFEVPADGAVPAALDDGDGSVSKRTAAAGALSDLDVG
jgi:hypothetical protein